MADQPFQAFIAAWGEVETIAAAAFTAAGTTWSITARVAGSNFPST